MNGQEADLAELAEAKKDGGMAELNTALGYAELNAGDTVRELLGARENHTYELHADGDPVELDAGQDNNARTGTVW
jgi:hypothetical protein